MQEIGEFEDQVEELKRENEELGEEIGKAKEENDDLKN